ncbi:hypothetical protein E2C01_000497 [Portunus trituberculatus]|uniref:Uncharacterized protein n=1 Tax=Portunus trituberculatus TaxID=210409 RepID=A0A5B7CEH5_PORTR|nr:hypothetical protein [Portunus trituberculatus]
MQRGMGVVVHVQSEVGVVMHVQSGVGFDVHLQSGVGIVMHVKSGLQWKGRGGTSADYVVVQYVHSGERGL